MRFMVTRVSMFREGRPCEEAQLAPYVRIDERTTNDPAKIPAYASQDPSWWLADGRNHRVEDGHIKRDFDAQGWFVDIDSLEDLIAFQEKYGRLVLSWHYTNPDIREIEIYDGYRE